MSKHGIDLSTGPDVRVRRKLRRAVRLAAQKTLATLPEVVAVLMADVDGERRMVTILADRSDEVIRRVAKQELALMRELGGVGFDFWTAPVDRRPDYQAAGYESIWERQRRADASAT